MIKKIFLFFVLISTMMLAQQTQHLISDDEEIVNYIKDSVKEFNYLTFNNYINRIVIEREYSEYLISIYKEMNDLYIYQVLKVADDKWQTYYIVDEKMLLKNHITEKTISELIKQFIILSNEAIHLEKSAG